MHTASVLAAAALKVLFVGNSLTYVHDVPAKVAELGASVGARIEVAAVTHPNFSLTDHWARGEAAKAIATGGFDVVVLQQGPTAAIENRPQLYKEAYRFARLIRKHGGRPALYMVWPSRARSQDWDGVIAAYTDAAKGADALLFPVGSAWRRALQSATPPALYGPDGFHPTEAGSTLAALVIVSTLLERSPDAFTLAGVPEDTAKALKAAALQAAIDSLKPRSSVTGAKEIEHEPDKREKKERTTEAK